MDRCSELLDRVVDGTVAAIERFDVDQFDHLVRHGGVSSRRFRDRLIKHLESKVRRDADAQLQSIEFPSKLAELQDAERRAWDRRAKYASAPENADSFDQPVQLYKYSTEQLTDCQLKVSRQQWLEELNARNLEATREVERLDVLQRERVAKMTSKIQELEERLNRLRATEHELKRMEK